jgi:hypothetical protein
MCRNSKLAKAETIPAQMRSSKSREESRRVVMDRQLIDKLVERKTKNSHRIPFFLFCLFVCFLLLDLASSVWKISQNWRQKNKRI